MTGNISDKNHILLSTAYLPPISYLKTIVNADITTIEQFENYHKQSYRNRCRIYAANGMLSLSIPVELATNKKILIKDVRIDNREAWQKQHLKSIESAYRTSPFFDYLIDDFLPFYTRNHTFLFEYNFGLLKVILDILQVDKNIILSSDYEHIPENKTDFRYYFSPKKQLGNVYNEKPYPQVFEHKFGFLYDLSCIDLIFNLGPQAYSYLFEKY